MAIKDNNLVLADNLSVGTSAGTTYTSAVAIGHVLFSDDSTELNVDKGLGLPPLYLEIEINTALDATTAATLAVSLVSGNVDDDVTFTSSTAATDNLIVTFPHEAAAGTRETYTIGVGDITGRAIGLKLVRSATMSGGTITASIHAGVQADKTFGYGNVYGRV